MHHQFWHWMKHQTPSDSSKRNNTVVWRFETTRFVRRRTTLTECPLIDVEQKLHIILNTDDHTVLQIATIPQQRRIKYMNRSLMINLDWFHESFRKFNFVWNYEFFLGKIITSHSLLKQKICMTHETSELKIFVFYCYQFDIAKSEFSKTRSQLLETWARLLPQQSVTSI